MRNFRERRQAIVNELAPPVDGHRELRSSTLTSQLLAYQGNSTQGQIRGSVPTAAYSAENRSNNPYICPNGCVGGHSRSATNVPGEIRTLYLLQYAVDNRGIAHDLDAEERGLR